MCRVVAEQVLIKESIKEKYLEHNKIKIKINFFFFFFFVSSSAAAAAAPSAAAALKPL